MQSTKVTLVYKAIDNGDGSHGVFFYDSIGQMLDNHELYQDDPTEETKEAILNNDVDYETWGNVRITDVCFDFKSKTNLILTEPFYIDTGNQ